MILCIILAILAITGWFQNEYYRTLGHPFRWDVPTYGEYDCFANDCNSINDDQNVP